MKEKTEKEKIEGWYNQFYHEVYQSSGKDKKYTESLMKEAKRGSYHQGYTPQEAADFLMI